MGLISKVIEKSTGTVKQEKVEQPNALTVEEYECLFSLIRNATFKGEQLDFIYNLTMKLQNQYLELKK
jgi:hypothetical protein